MKANIFYRFGEWVAVRYMQWRMKRDQKKRDSVISFWQCAAIGGKSGTIEIGYVTRPQAVAFVNGLDQGPIVHIDDERSFIAFGHPPEPR